MKIRVRVRSIPERVVNKELHKDNRVIMEKARRGKTVGWTIHVKPSALIPIKKSFGRLGYAIEVYPSALEAIAFPSSPVSEIDPPRLSAEQAAQINAADGFRRRYGDRPLGGGNNWIFAAIIILGIANLILLLRAQGVIRV